MRVVKAILLCFFSVGGFVPIRFAHELGQHAPIFGFAAITITNLSVLGCEGCFQNFTVIDNNLRAGLNVVKLDPIAISHYETPICKIAVKKVSVQTLKFYHENLT